MLRVGASSRLWRASSAAAAAAPVGYRWKKTPSGSDERRGIAGNVAENVESGLHKDGHGYFPHLGDRGGFSLQKQQPQESRQENDSAEFLRLCEKIAADRTEAVPLVREWIAKGKTLTLQKLAQMDDFLCSKRAFKSLWRVLCYARMNNLVEITEENLKREIALTCRYYCPRGAMNIYRNLPNKWKEMDEVTAFFILTLHMHGGLKEGMSLVSRSNPKTVKLFRALIFGYFQLDMHENVIYWYKRLKASQMEPNLKTYLVMLRYKRRLKYKWRLQGLEELEQEVRAALARIDLEQAELSTLDEMLGVYGLLGEGEKIEEVWEALRSKSLAQEPGLKGLRTALIAFGDAGRVERAEQILQEIKRRYQNQRKVYRLMVDIYAQAGMLDKAEKLLEQEKEHEHSKENRYVGNSLIRRYLASNQVDKALDRLKVAIERGPFGAAKVSYEVVMSLLKVLSTPGYSDRRGVATMLVQRYLIRHGGDVRLLNAYLTALIAAGEPASTGLLREFRAEPNMQTGKLLQALHLKAQDVFPRRWR